MPSVRTSERVFFTKEFVSKTNSLASGNAQESSKKMMMLGYETGIVWRWKIMHNCSPDKCGDLQRFQTHRYGCQGTAFLLLGSSYLCLTARVPHMNLCHQQAQRLRPSPDRARLYSRAQGSTCPLP